MNHTSTEILFDKFEVIECLKKDIHTSVYLASHIYLGKKIILKTLNTGELSDKTVLERFKREAKILASLEHPNLIKVLDFGTHTHFFYISFDYFDSRNLRAVIKDNSISFEDKNQLVIQLLKGLNVAHQNQVIHRDIKPENILVNQNLELKIVDFGLALIQNEHALTQKSSIVGTPGYMSPEQIRGETLTPQSDLFSAGLVAYELYTGKNPVLGKDISETINKILNFDESKLFGIGLLPEPAKNVVRSMLKKNAVQRLKTAADGLNMFGINATNYNLPKEDKKSSKKKKYLIYSAIIAIIIFAAAAWFINRGFFTLPATNRPVKTSENPPVSNYPEQKPTDKTGDQNSENTKEEKRTIPEQASSLLPGTLKIYAFPWANVEVDGKQYGSTPLQQDISLEPGRHTVSLKHKDFPEYKRRITIDPGSERSIKINFNDVVGFLKFRVEPWGKIYINNVFQGESSSLKKPVPLLPGSYLIKIENPSLGKKEKRIRVSQKETTTFEFNFNSVQN